MARLAIFLDGGYLDALTRRRFSRLRIDYAKLSEHVHGRVAEATGGPLDILRTYYYDCLPYQSLAPTDEESERYGRKRAFLHRLTTLPRYQVREGRLQYQGRDERGRPIFQQKRVDLLLGLDIALLSTKQQVSHIALLAGDSDFLPAVTLAKQEGVSLWLFHGPPRTYSEELWQEADERFEMDAAFMEAVRRA